MSDLYCCVQTPKGARLGGGQALADAAVCPADCGYFPETMRRPGRPLQAVVCVSEPHPPGGMIPVRPIALLRTRDREGYDEIVLCVELGDPAWGGLNRVQDLPAELQAEIERFIATVRPTPRNPPAIVGWGSRDDALTAIDDAAAQWAATVNGHG